VWSFLYALFPFEDIVIRPALAITALVLIVIVALCSNVLRGVRNVLGVQLLASPVLYPWYGASLAVANALAPSYWAFGLLAAMPFSYEVLDAYQHHQTWSPAQWPVVFNGAALVYGLWCDAHSNEDQKRDV
jgi:hypothetical protein